MKRLAIVCMCAGLLMSCQAKTMPPSEDMTGTREVTGNYYWFTDERAQDAIGLIIDDGSVGDIVFAYDDTTPGISATETDPGVTTHESSFTHANIAANTSARHVAATVTDGSTIDLTLTGQDITAEIIPAIPAAQTIAAGETIAADACGGIKQITAEGAVTTDTTDTLAAPGVANSGCCMHIVNIGAQTITMDTNANFYSAGAADVVVTANDALSVCSNGTAWYQISPLEAN